MEISSFRQIRLFILKLVLVAVMVLILDRCIGSVLRHFYFREGPGFDSQITYCIDSTHSDIVILGSSRANHSYVPEILEEKLRYTCYNSGRDGIQVLYNYAVFKAITKRYNPKMVIFDISPDELEYSAVEYERLSLLLPYYKTHQEMREIIDLRGPLEKIKHLSSIYYYNSLVFQIVRGNIGFGKDRGPDLKGYMPLYKKMKVNVVDTVRFNDGLIDRNKISALKDIISTCRNNKIELVFVYSPVWNIVPDSKSNSTLSKLSSENHIRYLNMSNIPTFANRPDYFADESHLNDEGARVFSALLTNQIAKSR
jgi:hypothetical protein